MLHKYNMLRLIIYSGFNLLQTIVALLNCYFKAFSDRSIICIIFEVVWDKSHFNVTNYRAAVKLKSAEVKDKLLEYIVNPNGGNVTTNDRHVSASDKLGKRYRNMAPVFSIDDDQDTPGRQHSF